MELYQLSALELSGLLQEQKCSALEIVRSVWKRIDSLEASLGAYITLSREDSLAKAAELDKKIARGEPAGPLAGIPVAVKDNICTRGIRTTCASRMLADFVPPYDAEAVRRISEAGAILLGKTNLDEFAMGSSCENSCFHDTGNPWDPNRVPGGSSGGSAAAVASGEAVLALGSDTGGSIRLPAAYCGAVGLRPTYGSVSRFGLTAFASSLDQVGPIGRSVADTALLYSVLCGWDKKDASTVQRSYPKFELPVSPSWHNIVVGIPSEFFGEEVCREAKEAVWNAARLMEKQGAILREVYLPGIRHALSAYYVLSSAEASSNLARYDGVRYGYRADDAASLDELYERSRSEGFGDEVKRRILLGTFVLSGGYYDEFYRRAQQARRRIRAEFAAIFRECSLLLAPTGTGPAFLLGEERNDPARMYQNDYCTVPASLAGLPALSIPCGMSKEKLPLGMQLIGPAFSEQKLFSVAAGYEALSGGFPHPWSEVG